MIVGALSAWMQFRFFDDAGKVLAGGKVYYAIAGGDRTQLGNVYSDASGTTPIANPVILDDVGTHAMYYGDLTMYHVWVDTADDLPIWNGEGYPFGGAGGGGSVTGSVVVVATYADLRALSTAPDVVLVKGRNIGADGGQGVFVLSPSALSDNDGTILTTVAAHSYVREYDGELDPAWFGVDHASTADQSVALTSACLVGPVASTGDIYLNSDYHVTAGHSIRFISGGFRTTGTPHLFFDTGSRFDSMVSNVFGTGIQVQFGRGVCDAIRLSWFGSLDQSLCSSYAYKYLIDIDSDMSGTVHFPANYEVSNEGGSILTAVALTNVKVENLAYQGIGQWLAFPQDAWVGTIDLGDVDAYLEWFGGVSGTSFTLQAQNQIPYHAAVMHGRIRLQDAYYVVGDRGAPIATGKAFRLVGELTQALQSAQAVTVAEFDATQVSYTGIGPVTAVGNLNLNQAEVLGLSQRTALAHAASAAVYVPHLFMAVGAGGSIRYATLINGTWTAAPGITDDISSIAKGPVWVATGTAGRVWTSSNNGATWASLLVDSAGNNLVRAEYINKVYIVCGAGGKIYTSSDAVTWNLLATTTTNTFRDVAYLTTASRYIFVGDAATVYTSDDLVTTAHRTLDPSITGNLLSVGASATSALVSGSLSGVYLRTVDGISYASRVLGRAVTIYGIVGNGSTFAMIDGIGNVWQSSTDGIVFLAQSVGSSTALLSIDYSGGTYLIGAAAGVVYTTADLKHFDVGYIGVGYNVLGVSLAAPVYAVVGAANSVQTSSDNVAYGPVTVDVSTADWNNAKTVNGVTYLLGASGRLFSTLDFQAFRSIPTGTTQALHDIVYNSVSQVWTICGANGYIADTANIGAVTPSWSVESVSSAETLRRMIWDGTRYTFIGSSTVWQRAAANTVPTQTNAKTITGMAFDGAGKQIIYGTAGLLLYSTDDGVTWTALTAFTTDDLTAATFASSTWLIGTSTGTIYRSTNQTTWTSVATLSGQINCFHWHSTGSLFGVVSAGHNVYTSPTGVTWTNVLGTVKTFAGVTHTGSEVYYKIWDFNGEWYVCGSAGLIMYAAVGSPNWVLPDYHIYGIPPASNWRGGGTVAGGTTWSLIFGDMGTQGMVNTSHLFVLNATVCGGANLIDYDQTTGVALDDTGKTWNMTEDGGGPTTLPATTAKMLAYDPHTTALFACGGGVWVTTATKGFYRWIPKYAALLGILAVTTVGAVTYAVGTGGFVATTSNGLLWTWAGVDGRTQDNHNAAWLLYNNYRLTDPVIGFASGDYGTIIATASAISSGGDVFKPVLTGLALVANESTATVGIVTTQGGNVSRSNLRDVSFTGGVSESSFSALSGVADGNVNLSDFTLSGTLACADGTVVSTTTIQKTDASDITKSPTFSCAGKLLLDAVTVDSNGSLFYGQSDTDELHAQACTFGASFTAGNGVGKVYLTGVTGDTSAFSVDGYKVASPIGGPLVGLEALHAASAGYFLTDTATNWYDPILPAGTAFAANVMTLGTAKYLGDKDSLNRLRYNDAGITPLADLVVYGGRITVEITYPTAPDPKSQISARLFTTRLSTSLKDYGICSTGSIGAGNLTVRINLDVWGGMLGETVDLAFLDIFDAYGAMMPVGTQIKVFAWTAVPASREIFDRFWPTAQSGHAYGYVSCDHNQGLIMAPVRTTVDLPIIS